MAEELDVGQQMDAENESSLVAAAKRHPYAASALGAAMTTPLAVPALGAAAIGYGVDQFYQGKGEEGRTAQRDASEQVTDRNASTEAEQSFPAWAMDQTKKVITGWTKPHWTHDRAQQAQGVEQKVISPEGGEAIEEERFHGVKAAAEGAQAKHREQTALYDIARDVEDERRGYADQERAAAERFKTDMMGAQVRLDEARERLKSFGDAPKATVAAAFQKAGGPQKVAGLLGMIMGGVGAAGFSAITHQPQRNAFFDSFEREARAAVDKWMVDRDTAGRALSAEQQGMDAIRQAFGDDRAAREFVMAAVMKTYAARLEQVAAQYGIDRTRADYQALLAQVAGKYADRQMALAANINEQQQTSQKYMQAQPIYAEVPVGQSAAEGADPTLNDDIAAWRAEEARLQGEAKKYGHPDRMPPELQQSIAANNERRRVLEARMERAKGAAQQAGARALMGPQSEATEERLKGYAEEREKRGINAKDRLRQASDRLVRRMQRGDQGLRQQIAMFVSAGATDRAEALVSRLLADDPELAQDWAYIANAYRLEQAGKSVTKNEIGTIVGAFGTGDLKSVAGVAENLARDVDAGERDLIAAFGEEPYQIYHARRNYPQRARARMPHNEARVPE